MLPPSGVDVCSLARSLAVRLLSSSLPSLIGRKSFELHAESVSRTGRRTPLFLFLREQYKERERDPLGGDFARAAQRVEGW